VASLMTLVSAVLVLLCRRTNRITDANDCYTHSARVTTESRRAAHSVPQLLLQPDLLVLILSIEDLNVALVNALMYTAGPSLMLY